MGPEARGDLLAGARALLHLIDFEEPFGYSVVEAMACGTPVIANARGSMPEIVRQAEGGYLVQSLDEAVAAVHASGEMDRLAVRASVERRFDVERMVDEYLDVYRRVVAQRRSGRTQARRRLIQGLRRRRRGGAQVSRSRMSPSGIAAMPLSRSEKPYGMIRSSPWIRLPHE